MQTKKAFGTVTALVVGLAGGYLFSKSERPKPGSLSDQIELAEERASKAERQARAMKQYIDRTGGSGTAAFRRLARNLKDGEEVSFDDVLGSAKPWMRRVSPVMDRVRKAKEGDWINEQVSKWSRNYTLSVTEKQQLREFFYRQSESNAKMLNEVIESNDSGFVDFVQATDADWRDFEGADDLMESFLEGKELADFREQRLEKRVKAVQKEADEKLGRLDQIVGLDEVQQRELFHVMARGSEDYRPEVNPEGYAGETAPLDRSARDAAINARLRPDQRESLNAHRQQQARKVIEQWEQYQLAPPKNYDLLEGDVF